MILDYPHSYFGHTRTCGFGCTTIQAAAERVVASVPHRNVMPGADAYNWSSPGGPFGAGHADGVGTTLLGDEVLDEAHYAAVVAHRIMHSSCPAFAAELTYVVSSSETIPAF